MNQESQYWIPPAWYRKLHLPVSDYDEWQVSKKTNPYPQKGVETMYQELTRISRGSQQRLLDCSTYLHDLYKKSSLGQINIQEQIQKQLKVPTNYNASYAKIAPNTKTIMLAGRTGEGKTTLVNQLLKGETNLLPNLLFQTNYMQLYQIKALGWNVLDTQGLDNNVKEDNQILLNSTIEDFMIHVKDSPSIDAIIVMWCPIKNGRSGLMKTIQNLNVACGEKVLESCIVMIQGNWRPLAEVLGLTDAVEEAVGEIKIAFPYIPVIEYDARGQDESQLDLLKEAIEKVNPYRGEYFEAHQKENFFDMISAIDFHEKKMQKKLMAIESRIDQEEDLQTELLRSRQKKSRESKGRKALRSLLTFALIFVFTGALGVFGAFTKFRSFFYVILQSMKTK